MLPWVQKYHKAWKLLLNHDKCITQVLAFFTLHLFAVEIQKVDESFNNSRLGACTKTLKLESLKDDIENFLAIMIFVKHLWILKPYVWNTFKSTVYYQNLCSKLTYRKLVDQVVVKAPFLSESWRFLVVHQFTARFLGCSVSGDRLCKRLSIWTLIQKADSENLASF